MNKRQRRIKRMKKRLTEQERKVLELFRESSRVEFYRHRCTEEEALEFAKLNGTPELHHRNSYWYESHNGKIEATGFFYREENND